MLEALPESWRGRVDAIVSNIPSVPPRFGGEHELGAPTGTTTGTGPDGLDLMRELADRARGVLVPGGLLVLEALDVHEAALIEELDGLG